MAIQLNQLNKLTPEAEHQLKNRGIRDTDDLLRAVRTHTGPAELARTLGLEPALVSDLTHVAELTKIRGIGLVYVHMLSVAGVNTIAQLAAQCPEELRARLVAINAQSRVAGRVPTEAMVRGWVAKAQRAMRGEPVQPPVALRGRPRYVEDRARTASFDS